MQGVRELVEAFGRDREKERVPESGWPAAESAVVRGLPDLDRHQKVFVPPEFVLRLQRDLRAILSLL